MNEQYQYDRVRYGAESFGVDRVADEHVPLAGQGYRQPNGGRVKGGRQILGQAEVDEAPIVRNVISIPPHRVEIHEARKRRESGHRIRHGHREQDGVGAVPHRFLQQHDADETVGDQR